MACHGKDDQNHKPNGSKDQGDTTETDTTDVPACPLTTPAVPGVGDAWQDAAAPDSWFEAIEVPGITDVDDRTTGVAWVDLDQDGDIDAVLSRNAEIAFLRNDGCFEMTPVDLDFSAPDADGLGGALAVDLSGDGFLDLYVPSNGSTRQALMLISDGAWDRFVDRAEQMGTANRGSYSRGGASLADVNRDGWWDFSISGHQIGGAVDLGRPMSRLFVFRPGPNGFEDGSYEDLGGTQAVPGYGGIDQFQCAPGDEATGLDSLLADINGDGLIDLLWATHNDMLATRSGDPCETGINPFGLRVWEGRASDDVLFEEQVEQPGSLASLGSMTYDPVAEHYVVGDEGAALGPETVLLVDFDNDGDRDVLALGPTDPDWHVTSDQTTPDGPGRQGALLEKDGNTWTDATTAAGLDGLNWTLGAWAVFFDSDVAETSPVMALVCDGGPQQNLCAELAPADRQPYPGHLVPLDYDNDGYVDLLYLIRFCSYTAADLGQVRSVLFHNRGDGSFEPVVTETSGVVGCSIAAFAADIDADGWVDLHYAKRQAQAEGDLEDLIFRNRGAERSENPNHWVNVDLEGLPETQLLGAQIIARTEGGDIIATGWYEREAWRGSRQPTVHLGLGTHTSAALTVTLPDGSSHPFSVEADSTHSLAVGP